MQKPRYHLYHSILLEAPLEDVWREVRDLSRLFQAAVQGPLPSIRWAEGCSAETVPARLEFVLQPGGPVFTEEVVGRSETEHWLSFRAVGALMSLVDYEGRVCLRPLTAEPRRTLLESQKWFALAEGTNAESFVGFYTRVVDQEMALLKAHFSRT